MFDITSLAVSPTSVLHLKGPDDELLHDAAGAPLTVEVYGPGSREFAAVDAEISNRNLARLQKGRGKGGLRAEQLREEQIFRLSRLTRGFSANFAYPRSAAEHNSLPWLEAVYGDREIGFIGDQVAAHFGDWANFKKPSPTN
jgi:hypothetical protein